MTVILRSVADVRAWRKGLPTGKKLGFVPTMGALHAGHLSLIELARQRGDFTIASIFVNPLQFGPSEDLARYPRPIEKDRALLEEAGADALFLPAVADLYPDGASTFVVEEDVSSPLCGAGRPGHFRGVATIVLKLFNIVQPDFAVFGQKDAQQCAVVERMVRDLNMSVDIVRAPIVREADGLALSSRNLYLTSEERSAAPAVYASLQMAKAAFESGERGADALKAVGQAVLSAKPGFTVIYWEVCNASSLNMMRTVGPDGALFVVAACIGSVRLIDNIGVN